MEIKDRDFNKYFMIYLCLFDMSILPIMHLFGKPFKFCYLICGLYFLFFLINSPVYFGDKLLFNYRNSRQMLKNNYVRKLVFCMVIIILATVIGEVTLHVITEVEFSTYFVEQIFGYVILIAFMGLGWDYYDYDKRFLIFVLFVFCAINISFSVLRDRTPYFLKYAYGMIGTRQEAELASERVMGTLGNANATLSLMNAIFMSIVVFYVKDLIKIKRHSLIIAISLMPILANIFLNSRGEFIVTCCLEMVFVYTAIKKQIDFRKKLNLVIMFLAIIIIGVILVWGVLAPKYPTVQFSLNRITSIFTNSEVQYYGKSESVLTRPFIHWDEFILRFRMSPLWGTGFGVSKDSQFIRSSMSYHNDWFGILASSGVFGGLCLIYMVYISAKKCGLFYILPFVVTAISNSFLFSYYAIGIYFMTVTILIRYETILKDDTSDKYDKSCI